jgi:Heavy metal associated domain 2
MSSHRVRTAHRTRGRIRLAVPNFKGDPRSLEDIKKAIAPMHGVRQVDVNSTTGSVTVHYDPALYGKFHDQLAAQGEASGAFNLDPPTFGEGGELIKNVEAEAEFLSRHSETARTIVDSFGALNQVVKRATDNNIDLKVLLPLGLAVYSFLEIGVEVSTPLWLTLGIFSFNSFVALHTRQDDTASDMEKERAELMATASPAPVIPKKVKKRIKAV